jgi:RNA polymerase sigma-70 factor, ECF subfamily
MDQDFSRQLVALLPRLRRFARGLTGSADLGDDLVQASCERALVRRNQFAQGSRLDSWMYRIMQNLWIDDRRRLRRDAVAVDPAELARRAGSEAGEAPDDRLYLAEVRDAIARLPEEQREVLLLVSVEGFSYRDAAEVLDLPIGTVMSRLSRGRLALGRELDKGRARGAGETNVVRIKR